ncbi:zinc finger protein 26-like isoform X2 [Bicyclus anynana]|nr:zinc finger protein 26-like isoform X2 [Bicyclus anynana]
MLQEGVQVVKEDVSNEKQQMEEGPEDVPLTHVSVEFLQKKDEDYDDYIPEVDKIKEITNDKFYKFVRDIQKLLTYTNAIPFRTRATRYYCFYCSTDGPLFEDPDELRSHTTTKHDKERISRVEQHMKPQWLNEVIKFDIKDLQCTECMLTLHDWNNMFVHFAETHDIGFDEAYTRVIPYSLTSDLQCVLCHEKFANYGLLDIHMNLHYSNHVCFKCGDTFLSVSRLDKHMTTHKTGNFPCTKCDKSFSLNYYLTRHVNLVHNQKTPKCVYCKKNVEGPMHLHISEEHSEKVKPLTCEVCGKVFTWKPYFVAHMRRNHIGVKKYKCEHCPKKFIKPYELKTHSITHTRLSRLFECGACKATFNSITSIKKHISVHDKEK